MPVLHIGGKLSNQCHIIIFAWKIVLSWRRRKYWHCKIYCQFTFHFMYFTYPSIHAIAMTFLRRDPHHSCISADKPLQSKLVFSRLPSQTSMPVALLGLLSSVLWNWKSTSWNYKVLRSEVRWSCKYAGLPFSGFFEALQHFKLTWAATRREKKSLPGISPEMKVGQLM